MDNQYFDLTDKRKKYSFKEAKELIARYCAYSERCHSEVRSRLYVYGLNTAEVEELMSELIERNYINEERFARAYSRGKFKHNKWGLNKIRTNLKKKQVSSRNIELGLSEIDQGEYYDLLLHLLNQKTDSIVETNQFIKKRKIADSLIRKGFEPEKVWDLIRSMS